MRAIHIIIFAIGLLAFLSAAAVPHSGLGVILWRTGIAAMLTDLAAMHLWPAKGRSIPTKG